MELQILLDEVDSHKDVIFNKHSTVVTKNKKKRLWKGICEKVNANSMGHSSRVGEKSGRPMPVIQRRRYPQIGERLQRQAKDRLHPS